MRTTSIMNIKNTSLNIPIKSVDNIKLVAANGSNIKLIGSIDVVIKCNGIELSSKYMEVDNLVGQN